MATKSTPPVKVAVPQQRGEIVLTTPAGSKIYAVEDGQTDVQPADLDGFLAAVEGANTASPQVTAETPQGDTNGA